MEELKKHIREVPEFPKPGILFYDITTLLQDPLALRKTVDQFVWLFSNQRIDKVVGIESRGFMFGPIVAYNLNAGFVPVRKPGKLPWTTRAVSYDLEYGSETLEMHVDALEPGERVLVIDDVLATGGTAAAAVALLERCGATVVGVSFLIEIGPLGGRAQLAGRQVDALVHVP